MIYYGNEKENHRGSHVKYFHGGKWLEGTLLEPVNYQIIVTKEHGPAVLSCHSLTDDNTTYEVKSVTITEANDISEEEAKVLIDGYIEKIKDNPA